MDGAYKTVFLVSFVGCQGRVLTGRNALAAIAHGTYKASIIPITITSPRHI